MSGLEAWGACPACGHPLHTGICFREYVGGRCYCKRQPTENAPHRHVWQWQHLTGTYACADCDATADELVPQ